MFMGIKSLVTRFSLFFIMLVFISRNSAMAQDSCPDPFGVMKQKKVHDITIPGTDAIHGYLEHLPDSYNANPAKRYPLLVYIHGVAETGSGSSADLCNILFQWGWWPAVEVEEDKFPHMVTDPNGQQQEFILITPQLVFFGDAVSTINSLLDYVISKYRVDLNRIYITGISAGADFIQSYAGSSDANAQRVAAVFSVAPCDIISGPQAVIMDRNNLPFWGTQCGVDETCNGLTAQSSANVLNSQNPAPKTHAWSTTFPVAGWPCNPFTHNAWGVSYDTTFIQTVNGRSVSPYEWMVQFSRSVAQGPLPVILEDFSAKLTDNKVYLQWKTAAEPNNQYFTILPVC